MGISGRICPQCGNALGPDAVNCSICGLRYVDTTNQEWLKPAASASFNAQFTPAPEQMDGVSAPEIVPLADERQTDRQYPFLPSHGFIQSLQGGKRPKLLFMAGLVIVLLVILGGSIFAIGRSKGSTTTTVSNNAVTPTPPPQSLFTDNFADNSKGWGVGSGKGFSCTIEHNVLSFSEANHRVLDIAIPGRNTVPALYGDFSVTAMFTLLKADQNDSVGLYVRGASTGGNFNQGYFVDIYGDNSYDIFKVFADANKDTFLANSTTSTLINPLGQQNKLTVDMKGPKMVVLINDKVLISVSDNDYKSGQIALFVENGKSSNGVQANFSSVLVNPVPNQLPGS